MFETTRLIAVAAALAVGGSLLLAGGSPGPADPVVAPSAESPPATEIAHFTGTMRVEGPGEGEVETLPGRMIERGSATWTTDVDDARLTGSATGSY